MPTAATSVSREARYLGSLLRTLVPSLPIYRDTGRGTARHIVYRWSGGSTLHNHNGSAYATRGVWLCYVSQPVNDERVYAEDLQADADGMHDVLLDAPGQSVDGRFVAVEREDIPHYLPVYDGSDLVEMQLGGYYVVVTSLE